MNQLPLNTTNLSTLQLSVTSSALELLAQTLLNGTADISDDTAQGRIGAELFFPFEKYYVSFMQVKSAFCSIIFFVVGTA